MATIHQRWEREQKRMEKKDWLTYQWEDLEQLLSRTRKDFLQRQVLGIMRFKNDEGRPLGRYTQPNKKGWVGFRERLKPFYIYKNKIMVLWHPNYSTKTGGEWKVMGYNQFDAEKISSDLSWMFENFQPCENMSDSDKQLIVRTLRENMNSWVPSSAAGIEPDDRLGWICVTENDKVQTGGSLIAASPSSIGSTNLKSVAWNDNGEPKNLKAAKQLAENIWKLNDINDSTFRWVRERDTGIQYSEQIARMADWLDTTTNRSIVEMFFWNHFPYTTNENLLTILTRPKMGFIINWHNYAPNV